MTIGKINVNDTVGMMLAFNAVAGFNLINSLLEGEFYYIFKDDLDSLAEKIQQHAQDYEVNNESE